MQDRVPQYPGRVKLTPVSGQENTYDMIRADSPTQEGTALNKNSLLKDSTAALYGLGSDAVPDEVLAKIPEKINVDGVFEVGDTLSTLRTDLGDKWLLANGEVVDVAEYPNIGAHATNFAAELIGSMDTTVYLTDVAYYNGTWVAVGYANKYNYPYVYVKTSGSSSWVEKKIRTSTLVLKGVYCYNGTWVAVGHSDYYPYVCTSTDPANVWAIQQIGSNKCILTDVICYNGTWVAVGYNNNIYRPRAFITTTPTGTWAENDMGNDGGMNFQGLLNRVACYNGIWVACVSNTGGQDDALSSVWVATDPAGTWTRNKVDTSESVLLYDITCYNGTWVTVGYVPGMSPVPYVYTTTDPSGEWEKHRIGSDSTAVYCVCCDGTNWYVGGVLKLYKTANLQGEWSTVSISPISSPGAMGFAADVVMVVGNNNSNYPYIATNSSVALPTISIDGVYTYIKVKE